MEKKGNYKLIKKIGEGTYSTVYMVSHITNNNEMQGKKKLAMKVVQLDNFNEEEIQNILNEIKILAILNHPNTVRYVESFALRSPKLLWYLIYGLI